MLIDTYCKNCLLRRLPSFLENCISDIEVVQSLKQRELRLQAGETLIHEGAHNSRLFTLLDGWAFRFKTLSDGRRQILSFLLAGDLIGVQHKVTDVASHGVATLTDAVFCGFQPDSLWEMHRQSPRLGFNVTWLTAREESLTDNALLSVGRRNGEERIAALLLVLFKRAASVQTDGGAAGVPFPLTQQHVADSVGLSLVYTNRTLRKLERLGLHRIVDGRLHVLDFTALERVADLFEDGYSAPRPLV